MLFIPSSDTAMDMVTHQPLVSTPPHLPLSNFGEPVGIVSPFFSFFLFPTKASCKHCGWLRPEPMVFCVSSIPTYLVTSGCSKGLFEVLFPYCHLNPVWLFPSHLWHQWGFLCRSLHVFFPSQDNSLETLEMVVMSWKSRQFVGWSHLNSFSFPMLIFALNFSRCIFTRSTCTSEIGCSHVVGYLWKRVVAWVYQTKWFLRWKLPTDEWCFHEGSHGGFW